MLRFFLLSLSLSLGLCLQSSDGLAIQLIVDDLCSEAKWLNVQASAEVGDDVGAATVATLQAQAIEFVGTERGIKSILATVTGDEAFELLSDSEMRAYGWCFRVNGVLAETYPDKVTLQNQDDVIHWFFGYAHYLEGVWSSYCTPTASMKPDFICKEK